MLKNIKIGPKLTGGFVLVALLAVCGGVVSLWGVSKVKGNLNHVAEENLPTIDSLRTMAAGFEKDRASPLDQPLHERVDVRLEQGLAPGNLDQIASERQDLANHVVNGTGAPPGECVRRIAPRTAQVTAGEPDEYARPPCEGRFTLDRMEDLADPKHRRSL